MCDFFVGSIYCDWIINPHAPWFTSEEKEKLAKEYPEFMEYGKRFVEANKAWMDRRETVGGKWKY